MSQVLEGLGNVIDMLQKQSDKKGKRVNSQKSANRSKASGKHSSEIKQKSRRKHA